MSNNNNNNSTIDKELLKDKKYDEEVQQVLLDTTKPKTTDMGAEIVEAETIEVDYVPITKQEELDIIVSQYPKSTAPKGYVFDDELEAIKGQVVKLQRIDTSLQSIIYGGLIAISRDKVQKREEVYGDNFTRAQVLANINLMRIYLPKEYEQELWAIQAANDQNNRRGRTGCRLGGGSSRIYR